MPDILEYCKGRKSQTFKSGEVLIQEGGTDHKLFVLIEGQVEVLRSDTQVSYIEEPGSLESPGWDCRSAASPLCCIRATWASIMGSMAP